MKKTFLPLLVLCFFQTFLTDAHAISDREMRSEKGLFFVEMHAEDDELKLGKNRVNIIVRDQSGGGVEGLDISVQPWMPEMGHGVGVEPVIQEEGGGSYILDNVYTSMGGLWELRLNIKQEDLEDRVVFSFPNVGGMMMTGQDHMHMHNMSGMEPIGVMGAHTHQSGKWMLSYRYMYMSMDGNRDGTDGMSKDDVLDDFMVAPLDMSMEMHMVGIMYAPTNNLSIMAMIPYIEKEMDHETRLGADFTTKTDGVGDVKVSALYRLFEKEGTQVLFNVGLGFPTGSIDEKGDTPMGDNIQLPYPMQLGSGTYDLLPGITYLCGYNSWSWGSQLQAVIRIGENENDYTLGDRYALTAWIARSWSDWFSSSLRLDGTSWGDIDGRDPDIAKENMANVAIVPTADPDLRGGSRIDMLIGFDLAAPSGTLSNGRFALEGGFPIYQDLDGPQLETDWKVTAGLQWLF